MRKKKAIKQLQALGVQRNEAAGFIAAYRKIKAAGKLGQLPGIVEPIRPPLLRVSTYDVRPFVATLRTPDLPLCNEVKAGIHAHLAQELGLGLLNEGAIEIHDRELPPASRYAVDHLPTVEYTATVNVAMRRETA